MMIWEFTTWLAKERNFNGVLRSTFLEQRCFGAICKSQISASRLNLFGLKNLTLGSIL
ncbi:hypothetical protein Csa_012473, partial [Cucumis sativus]